MSRGKGTFNFAANLEPLLAGPIDARTVVGLYSDLIDPSTWKIRNGAVWGEAWVYTGMPVYVQSDPSKGLYILTDSAAYNVYSSWFKLADVSSLNNIIDGLSLFLPSASIGTGFAWNAGMLDVSVAGGGGGTGDVTKLYVDGSLATKVSKAGDTMTGNLSISTAAPKLFLTDTNTPFLTLGLASEVGGQLLDFGSNYHQLSTIDASYPGGYFRIDLRDALASEFFGVHYVPVGGVETVPFKLSRTGDLVTDGSITAGGNLIVTGTGGAGDDATPAWSPALIGLQNDLTHSSVISFGNSGYSNHGTFIKFTVNNRVTASTPIDAMVINNYGNVGIGTNAPGQLLTLQKIVSGQNIAKLSFEGQTGDAANSDNGGVEFHNDNYAYYSGVYGWRGGDSTQSGLNFKTANNAVPTTVMTILPSGNVGITGTVTARDYVQVLDTGGAEGFKMQWNDTEKSIDFIIN